jgi:long-chain acyl-CoA synthetase
VTTIYVKLLAYARELERTPDLRSLRLCVSGGEPRNEPAFDRWRELTGCPVHDVYCASECFPVVTYDPHVDPQPRPGCAGNVVPEARMRVVDETGRDVSTGEVGEALWRGPALMLGYWEEPELTAAAFTADGWYRSRDWARMDEDGYVYVTGRVSDMIIRGGSNVSPAEVEGVLYQHPHVADVAVVGVPDEEYGEQVAAAIVLEPGGRFDPQAFARFCESKLAPFKIPTLFRELPELPRNANGKVVRRDIAPLLARDAVEAS